MSAIDKPFEHPLARKAKVWQAHLKRGKAPRLLVIVTTLTLDEAHSGYSARNMERLAKAAQDYIDARKDLDGYLFVNRAKDWDAWKYRDA